MAGLRQLFARIGAFFRKDRLDSELAAEIASHLELLAEEHERRGLSPAEARLAARREFGGVLQLREAHRDARGLPGLDALVQDLRFALRGLRRDPGFTAVAVLTLALGIGANTAIFTLLHTAVVKTLPVPEPGRLVVLASRGGETESDNRSFSYPMYADLRDAAPRLARVAAFARAQASLSFGGSSEVVGAELVSGNYFEVLGLRPWLGRLLAPTDDRTSGAHPVAVLSHGYWQRRFGGDPGIVGRTIVLNGRPLTVVGISPPAFYGAEIGRSIDVRLPMMMTTLLRPVPADRLQRRNHQWLSMLARLGDGVSEPEARAALGAAYQAAREGELGARKTPLGEYDLRRYRAERLALLPGAHGLGRTRQMLAPSLLLLQGVSGIVLLIACANLANMLLARNAARRREVAVRMALGAGRRRLVRQWLTESLLLATVGAGLGLPLALWLRGALRAFAPAEAQAVLDAPLDPAVFAFTLAVASAAGVLAGLAPALQATRDAVGATLRSEAAVVAGGERVLSLRGGLVLAQLAMSVPLLFGAGLLVQSLRNIYGIDPGFATGSVLVGTLNPSLNGYSPERIAAYYREALAAVRALPGVRSASLASDSALSGGWDQERVAVEGYSPREGERMSPNAALVTPGHFGTLGIPIIEGRDFTDRDVLGAPKVAIVNQTMARYFFGERGAVGRRMSTESNGGFEIEIVGVVRDAKYVDLREKTPRHFYVPVAQVPRLFELTLHVQVDGEADQALTGVRSALAAVDPEVPLSDAGTLAAQLDRSLATERLIAWLSGALGLLALLLASVGLYGVVAFSVARRTREIGVRVALGARGGDVVWLVLRRMGAVVGAGLAAGSLASAAVGRLLGGLLYEVEARSLPVHLAALVLLVAVSAFAAWLPARRAARVDPVAALRCD